jgi:dihydroceramidase
MRPEEFGYWGAVTSSIDWCETNYVHLRYICEFFNTVSSFAMLGVGLLGLLLHRRVFERRFLLAFFALAVVGFGSAAFHATLRYEFQMLDELPMLYLALVMVFILVENRPVKHRSGRRLGPWFPWALAAHGVLVTLLSAGTRGSLQFLAFHLSFGSLELFCLVCVTLLYRRSRNSGARQLYRLGMSAYLLAIVLWFIDLRFCSFLNTALPFNPQLHALWHLLVSLGFYCLIVFIAHERLSALGAEPKLRAAVGVLPRLAR